MMSCTGIRGTLPGVAAPSIQAQLYRLEQHYHLQKEMLSRQFEEDQRLLEHEKQQYKMQVLYALSHCQLCRLISETEADMVCLMITLLYTRLVCFYNFITTRLYQRDTCISVHQLFYVTVLLHLLYLSVSQHSRYQPEIAAFPQSISSRSSLIQPSP